jgi:hypothetical protein
MCLVRISGSVKDQLFHSNDDNFAESASHTFVSSGFLVERLAQADKKVSFSMSSTDEELSEELAMARTSVVGVAEERVKATLQAATGSLCRPRLTTPPPIIVSRHKVVMTDSFHIILEINLTGHLQILTRSRYVAYWEGEWRRRSSECTSSLVRM